MVSKDKTFCQSKVRSKIIKMGAFVPLLYLGCSKTLRFNDS